MARDPVVHHRENAVGCGESSVLLPEVFNRTFADAEGLANPTDLAQTQL